MAPDLQATFRKPFREQVAAFRLRLSTLQPTAKWNDLWQAQHDRAFMVAGATKADLLADLAAAVDKAVSKGTTLEEFRRDFRAIVEKNGWHGWKGEGTERGEAWRTKVIYKTNMRTSYAAGRWAQLKAAGYPLLIYRHGGSLDPRVEHLGWDGLILSSDHPFWVTHAPPNGWGCSCYINGARSEAGAVRLGGKPGKTLPANWNVRDGGTGAPAGIDKGWAYAPGATAAADITVLANKLPALPAEIGASLFGLAIREREALQLQASWSEFLDTSLKTQVQQRSMIVGALLPEWVAAAESHGVKIASAEIAVTDKGIQHTFRGTPALTVPGRRAGAIGPKQRPLDLDWFRLLPAHLRAPQAVLLDKTGKDHALILVYPVEGSLAKLVIRVDVDVQRRGIMNTVTTGRIVDLPDIKADVSRGVKVIEGRI